MSALNLATIVLRLAQHPRGWRVDDLCAELEIKPRTYRKYRQVLQEQFRPFFREGVSLVQEVSEPGGRYLRLVEPLPPPPGRDAHIAVDVLFGPTPWLHKYVSERVWYPGQAFEDVTGGKLRMTFRVASLDGVVAWLQQFGDDVEVLKPSELRHALGRGRP